MDVRQLSAEGFQLVRQLALVIQATGRDFSFDPGEIAAYRAAVAHVAVLHTLQLGAVLLCFGHQGGISPGNQLGTGITAAQLAPGVGCRRVGQYLCGTGAKCFERCLELIELLDGDTITDMGREIVGEFARVRIQRHCAVFAERGERQQYRQPGNISAANIQKPGD